MDSLERAQKELYEALRGFGPCFLRVCASQDALWVCDLLRRAADTGPAKAALQALDVCYTEDPETRLWKLDWTRERYLAMDKALPHAPPPFPNNPALEEAYALCRLLLLHPAPPSRQPVAIVREVLKLDQDALTAQPGPIRRLHGQCAAAFRRGEPLPSLAGGLLCEWITRMERGSNA